MLGLAIVVTRVGVVKPVTRIRETLGTLAAGNFRITVADTDRTDEIGRMAEAAERLRQGLEEAERMREEARLAEIRAAERLKAERNAIADEFESKMGALARAFANSSGEVSSAARASPRAPRRPPVRRSPSPVPPRRPRPTCRPSPPRPRR